MSDFKTPRRQSPIGVAVIFVQNLRTGINIFISLFAVNYGFNANWSSAVFTGIISAVVVGFVVISILQYRKFYFYVEGDKFIIEKGVFSKDKITIPFERIQSVHIHQNIVQRLLNVVGIKVDTAGSSKKELEISALHKEDAYALQAFLSAKKEGENIDGQKTEEIKEGHKEPLIHLGIKDLLRIGLTENHLRTALVVFAVLQGYIWQFEEFLRPLEVYVNEGKNAFMAMWVILLPLSIIVFLIIAVLISTIRSVFKYYNLQFFVDDKGVQLKAGLLKRNAYQIPHGKVQYLKWSSNPLRKLIGFKTLVVKQAASAEVNDKKSFKIPGCNEMHIQAVLQEFFPIERESAFMAYSTHILLAFQRSLFISLLPALVLFLLSLSLGVLWLLIASLCWFAVSLFFIFKWAKTLQLEVNNDMIMYSLGWVYPQKIALKLDKLQSVKMKQSIFQKKRGLSTLTFYTAAGSINVPYIPQEVALDLYNYSLYKIETNYKGWM